MTYPPDWPRCVFCGDFALDGHLTCGHVECSESQARDAQTQRYRMLRERAQAAPEVSDG